MGRRKKFIDKKRSATFQLVARDTATDAAAGDGGSSPPSDRVFIRVDRNAYPVPASLSTAEDPDSIFADAPGDPGDPSGSPWLQRRPAAGPRASISLPERVRSEILGLGLPDDGYNYLLHLREIKNTGGGAAYYHNDRARMDLVPIDVKAYDASRLRIGNGDAFDEEGVACAVASGTVGVKVGRVADPAVVKLLEDGELSLFGSDVEDLEEDFVAMANRDDEGDDENVAVEKRVGVEGWLEEAEEEACVEGYEPIPESQAVDEVGGRFGGEKQRARRLLDAQFDLLALREYDSESDSDDVDYVKKEEESLAVKLNDALKDYSVDDLELENKYKAPADYIRCDQGADKNILVNSSVEVLRKCAEYAEMYSHDDKDEEEIVLLQESSDESEVWDCETIVTTYTNLDNHPGKISAPEKPRKKLPELTNGKGNVISLRGKEKIPVDFLPNNKRMSTEKVKILGAEQPNKRSQDESKEAKKERKAAVKEEKKEARRAKKELKELYRSEAQKAQKVAAFTGPSSIHLM